MCWCATYPEDVAAGEECVLDGSVSLHVFTAADEEEEEEEEEEEVVCRRAEFLHTPGSLQECWGRSFPAHSLLGERQTAVPPAVSQ